MRVQRWFYGSATALIGVVLLWIAFQLLARISTAVTVLVAGATLAFLLAPIADRLESWVGRRWLAVLLVMVGLVLAFLLALVLVVGPLLSDLLTLIDQIPRYIQRIEELFKEADAWLVTRGWRGQAEEALLQLLSTLRSSAPNVLVGAVAVLGKMGTWITEAVLAVVVATYLLLEGHGLRQRIYRFLPAGPAQRFFQIENVMARTVGGFLRGQLLLALIIGVAAGVGMAFLGLPYPVFLGVMAGLFELIPTVGAVLGAVPAVLVALFESFPKVLYVALYFFVVQQIESLVLVPRITSQTVGIHPVVSLLALVAGFEFAGVAGALLSVPVTAAAWAIAMLWLSPATDPGAGSTAGSNKPGDREGNS